MHDKIFQCFADCGLGHRPMSRKFIALAVGELILEHGIRLTSIVWIARCEARISTLSQVYEKADCPIEKRRERRALRTIDPDLAVGLISMMRKLMPQIADRCDLGAVIVYRDI